MMPVLSEKPYHGLTSSCTRWFVLARVSDTVVQHLPKVTWGRKGFFWLTYISWRDTKAGACRRELKRRPWRSPGLSPKTCSSSSLLQPRPSCLGMALLTVVTSLLGMSCSSWQSRKCPHIGPQDSPMGEVPHLRSPSPGCRVQNGS